MESPNKEFVMSEGIRYTEEFKKDAVSQVTDRGYSVKELSDRLGISTKSLYDWIKQFKKPVSLRVQEAEQVRENCRLKAELARVTEERDILKKATAYFARETK
jgi:transposase